MAHPHGTTSAYVFDRCRCALCRAANAAQCARRRQRSRARRTLVDERWVASYLAPEAHGLRETYVNHSCRCPPCTGANTEYGREPA